MAFGGFIGVKFEAERIKTYVGQTFLHDTQRRHFLGDEQHPFALVKCVGYQIGDGLRLTGSGRSVEYERIAIAPFNDGRDL